MLSNCIPHQSTMWFLWHKSHVRIVTMAILPIHLPHIISGSMIGGCTGWLIGPWWNWMKFSICDFQTYFSDWWLRHLLWNCPYRNVIGLTDDQSTLVQVLGWCHQATSHYLSQCWPRSMASYGVTRGQWVNSLAPGKYGYNFNRIIFKNHFMDSFL